MTDDYQDIFIYVNKQGKLICLPAFISKKKPMKLAFAIPAFDSDNKHILRMVAREPGMIFENSVWFKKKNFERAKELFMIDYGDKISKLYSDYEQAQEELNWLSNQEKEDK